MPTIWLRGMSTFTFFRLCTRAPRIRILPGAALSVLICGRLPFAVSFAAIVPRRAQGGKGNRPGGAKQKTVCTARPNLAGAYGSPLMIKCGWRKSAQVRAVGGDDLLVPVEAVLALAGQIAGAVVELVDVDEAVALGHLAGAGGYQVEAAPGGVAHQVHAVLDGRGHLGDVLAQVVDAVAVVDLAVGVLDVLGAQAVFHHHDGDAVAVVDLLQGVA